MNGSTRTARWPRARAGVAAALCGVALSGTTGCSPAERTLVAVLVDGSGTPHALLRPCDGGDRVRAPWLHGTPEADAPERQETREGTEEETGQETGAAGGREWSGWETRGTHPAADFPLFTPPAPWRAEIRGPRSALPDHSYELGFADPDDSYAYRALVTFDAAGLDRLADGEVLTRRGVMSRSAFEEAARRAC
ncbi:hypothetical protein [Streptomyces clavuligerus]|nr:hypothetical protein [Streptomyces clavuligerus]WDN55148.1 hypothetical protein LL058_26735 [Streptomyces clavuligerus]